MLLYFHFKTLFIGLTLKNQQIIFAFLISLLATFGSLFFSEVLNYIPCTLCWYQRIFMYPLFFIFTVNLLYPDEKVLKYAMPLVVVGLSISIYHNLLMYGIIPEEASPCVQGVPCSTRYINWLGFITIPFLSLVSFVSIFGLLLNKYFKEKKN